MCDGGGRAQGCGKEKAAARSSFLGFPVMGVMRVRRSEICSLRAHWPVRLSHSTVQYTITYIATTVPTDKATSYTSTFLTGISITLLRNAQCILKYQNRDFPKVIVLCRMIIMCLLIAGTRKSTCSNNFENFVFKNHMKSILTTVRFITTVLPVISKIITWDT